MSTPLRRSPFSPSAGHQRSVRTDDQLMRAAASGNRDAFEVLYHRHAQHVFAYLWRQLGEEAVAADLRQEAFVRLWLARDRWRENGSVIGFLLRAARNLAINHRRSCRVRERWSDSQRLAPSPTAPAPDALLLQRQLAARVQEAIDALPERPRQVFSLKRDAGLSYREIAEILGIAPKTVEVHMTRALRELRVALADLREPREPGPIPPFPGPA